MSKHDYTKHSNKKYNKNADRPKPEVKTSIAEMKPEPEVVLEPVVETVETVALPIGRVVSCTKLSVREQPNPYGNILCHIPYDAKVIIDHNKSTWNFYKVYTEHGIEGYCMKKNIEVDT